MLLLLAIAILKLIPLECIILALSNQTASKNKRNTEVVSLSVFDLFVKSHSNR